MIVIIIPGGLDRADIPRLCADACARIGCGGELVLCDVRAVTSPDAVAVDALAKLQLVAKRLGSQFRICGATKELRELLELSGLADVLLTASGSSLQALGQPEQGEKRRGVEEETDPGDRAVGDLDDL